MVLKKFFLRKLRDLYFFRVTFWNFISFFWLGHTSLFLCVPCTLLLRFKHSKKTTNFPSLYALSSCRARPLTISLAKGSQRSQNFFGDVFSLSLVHAFICLNSPSSLPLFLLKSHSLLLPQYLFMGMRILWSSNTLQCSPFFSARKLSQGFQQCSESGETKTMPITSQNTGLDVLSFVSTPREKPGYGRFPPGSIALGWVQGGAWTHKNTKNIPTPFNGVPSWLCFGLGTATSQLVSRVFTKVFWSIYCC